MSKPTMFAGFLLLIAVDTFVQIAFKFAGENTLPVTFDAAWLQRVAAEPWLLGVAVGGIAAFLTYMTLIRHAPIGPAFAASHLDIVSITLFSVWYFGDRLSLMQVLGCSAIVLGVLVLAYGESRP
ncbi:MAG TPA: EamA family transporter [Hyphomicrobiaceae bacterium]|nr:EamA family transporter [Hyphomicrobiaceae bacterium]